MDATSTAADMFKCRRVTEVKLGKYVHFIFSWSMLRLLSPPLFLTSSHSYTAGAYKAPAPKFANRL